LSKEKCIKQLGVECPHCHKILPLTISMPTYCPNCKKVMAMGYMTTFDNYIKEENES
jgi:hypothetical protein